MTNLEQTLLTKNQMYPVQPASVVNTKLSKNYFY